MNSLSFPIFNTCNLYRGYITLNSEILMFAEHLSAKIASVQVQELLRSIQFLSCVFMFFFCFIKMQNITFHIDLCNH